VLGAGNCFDLDLARLTQTFTEVHLVDLDRTSVETAISRESAATRSRLECHAPVELSGLFDRLEYWCTEPPSTSEIEECADLASYELADELPGPFDVVLSARLLSELHRMIARVIAPTHAMFETASELTNLVHLRRMMELLIPGGRGILTTDALSDAAYPREKLEAAPDLAALLDDLQRSGKLFHSTQPGVLSFACWNDALLRRGLRLDPVTRAWLRRSGRSEMDLVYALEFQRWV
jgi:hypothetical protein